MSIACLLAPALGLGLAPGLTVGVPVASGAGDASETHVQDVAARISQEIGADQTLQVVRIDQALQDTCTDAACLGDFAKASASSYLVRAGLSALDRDYELKLEVLDPSSGSVVASATGSCELCTDPEVGEMITRTAARLREPLAALRSQRALLVVSGTPTGASVSVDGELVGETPYQGEVDPGSHQLAVTYPEHSAHTQRWLAEAGVTFESEYQLEPIAAIAARKPAMRHAGWALVGVGGATMIAGSVALVLHGRPVKSSCPDGVADTNGRCPRMYSTLGAGLGTLGAGLVVTTVGGILLGVDAKRRRRPVDVAVGPRSLVVSGRF